MWRPAERIKYKPQPGDWPTREEAARSMLFSPVDVGAVQLQQRSWVPAMVPWRATEDGMITDDLLAWYERYARGQPGAIVVEATGIRDIRSGPLLRIGHDRFIPGLRQLVDTVRVASAGKTRLFIQIIDFLRINRRPPAEKYFSRYLEITDAHRDYFYNKLSDDEIRAQLLELNDEALREALTAREYEALTYGYRERVSDLHLPHIRELPETLPGLFADAAGRAREAGFDGVELHYAHAYTMASFLSARNTRDDGYGGDLEGRVRLPLEVLAAVRNKVGHDYTVGCRYLSEDCIDKGMSNEDAAWFGVRFAAAGMDFLSLSRGGKFEDAKQPKVGAAAYPYTGRSGYECMPQYISDEIGPFGRNLPNTARIRKAVRDAGYETPVVAAGGIHGFVEAERVLQNGEADIIAAARQSIADPDWFLKARLGLGDQVRVCIYSNYCEALDTRHKQVTCELWDREDKDAPGVALSWDGKRRLLPPDWQPPGDPAGE
ncbi:MAG: NADH:flavin oxidoreductase [Gammaproteobacteria bacterium]|nr:NADH:flavin oxidoreductase [Gammaproteobacteria bacterium]